MLVRAEIDPAKLGDLEELLKEIALETNAFMKGKKTSADETRAKLIPFELMNTIHFARFVVIDDTKHPQTEPEPPLLIFSTNYDGPEGDESANERDARSLHQDQLIAYAADGLDRVFSHCRGYTGKAELKRFMNKRHVGATTFYVGSSGRSRDQILSEKRLRERIQQALNEKILTTPEGQQQSPDEIRNQVIDELKHIDEFRSGVPTFPAQPDLMGKVDRATSALNKLKYLYFAILAGLFLGSVLNPIFSWGIWWWLLPAIFLFLTVPPALAVWWFRHLEKTDVPFEPREDVKAHQRQKWAAATENEYHQNQLTHMVKVKPGWVRAVVIRAVWFALQFLANNQFNRGKLGDIPTIQFARWALIGNRNVLFMSNFDASWQSYLGDFIDKASSGLTGVWSNTQGYPRTKWLLKAGSRDAARFLGWTRYHQLPTAVWYGAYPALSIVNVNDNTEIRRGVADSSAMDAETWLYFLRAAHKPEADKQAGNEYAREPMLALDNIQGIVLRGYGHKNGARFLMCRVKKDAEVSALRHWIGGLDIANASRAPKAQNHDGPFINIAFSYEGLKAMELDPELINGFPLAYVEDSNHYYRRQINGDIGDNSPEFWDWGSEENEVHLVLLVYANDDTEAGVVADGLLNDCKDWLQLVIDKPLEGRRLHGRKEHFGFRDGIAQPVVAGSGRPEVAGNTIAAGEFLLGHRDGYDNVFHGPVSGNGFNFGLDGSYLVFRQLSQNVEDFWSYCAQQEQVGTPVTVASKMVGRWPSGAPLLRHPDADPKSTRFEDEDNFNYLETNHYNDRYGARCPFGSHLRRSNPRDWEVGIDRGESLRLSHLHRIIRRGRPYGDPVDTELDPEAMIKAAEDGTNKKPRGLHFLAFNSNIERQFEFVQQQWCGNSKFSHLTSGAGPLLGPFRGQEQGNEEPTFTVQTDVNEHVLPECTGLDSFVNTKGSTYFFMPSLTGVRMMADAVVAPKGELPKLEQVPANEQVSIDSLIGRLRDKMRESYEGGSTKRDAHPKMHGCLEAEFAIEPNLPEALRVGVFAEEKTFKAWVRLSNADNKIQDDATKDIRGFAIKLLEVAGDKLLDGEEFCNTHDFLAITTPTFLAKDVAGFDALVAALFGGLGGIAKLAVSSPATLWRARKSQIGVSDLLARDYFSCVPYLFGSRAAKYKLTPSAKLHGPHVGKGNPNFLRMRLAERLKQQDVSFDFMIQFQDDPAKQPVENPLVKWKSKFTKIATVTLRKQYFDTPDRDRFGENLSFNPWRALVEHRPLGGINRARRQVYMALTRFRHERNLIDRWEPGPDWTMTRPEPRKH